MYCPACGTQTNSRFCPHCGADVAPDPNAAYIPGPPGPGGAPGAPVTTAVAPPEVRNWVTACHASALAGLVIPFGNVIGPLVVWLMKRDASPLIDREGKESLNFQISMTLYLLISGLMIFILIGIPLVFVISVTDLILTIVGTVNAANGTTYRYPLTIRFLN